MLEIVFGKGKKEKTLFIWKDASGNVIVELEKGNKLLLEKVFVVDELTQSDSAEE